MKIGMIGLDTSHCPAFTRILNDSTHEFHLKGAQVISAYPGGSDIFSLSRDRVQGYTDQLKTDFGVNIRDSIADVVADADAMLLESVDGRQHLEQFQQMAVGKPVFVDKPFATSTADARAMINLARETDTPLMSSSSLRYALGIANLITANDSILTCEAFGPAAILDDYPGLFWYGIHSVEMLYAMLGVGCQQVRCQVFDDQDIIIGEWRDGRTGVIRGTRLDKNEFGCIIHTNDGVKMGTPASQPPTYFSLLEAVIPFFNTGTSSIPIEETFEIIAFLEAANTSRENAGQATVLETL